MRHAAAALAADLVAVLVFAVIGRRSHTEGLDLPGIATTAAPFLAGLLVGWVAARLWRDPSRPVAGLAAAGGAAVVGLALRGAVTGRLPVTFVLVASVSLMVLMVGWRVLAAVLLRTRRPSI